MTTNPHPSDAEAMVKALSDAQEKLRVALMAMERVNDPDLQGETLMLIDVLSSVVARKVHHQERADEINWKPGGILGNAPQKKVMFDVR